MLFGRVISTESVERAHLEEVAEREAWQGTPEAKRTVKNYLLSVDKHGEQIIATLEDCATNTVLHQQTAKKLAAGFAALYGIHTTRPVYFDTPTTPAFLSQTLQDELFSAMASSVRSINGIHLVSTTPREERLEYILSKEKYRRIPGGLYVSE